MISPKSTYLIGLDLGTSGAKAILMDLHGRVLAQTFREYPIFTPHPGWAEENPSDWLEASVSCLKELITESGVDPSTVAGIGLTGQMHSLVCLDSTGKTLRPAILWADTRSAPQAQRALADLGKEKLAAYTGNPLPAGFMLSSWLWLQANEPDTARQTRWLLLPKDMVRYRLTGTLETEPSDASSTGLFDVHCRGWSQPMLAYAGLSPQQLPPITPSQAVCGSLLPEMARACRLLPGTPVVAGCSDQSAQALAQGILRAGEYSITIGTGGQVFTSLPQPQPDPELRVHLFCHALPNLWHLEAAILNAGLSMRWLRDNVWPGSTYAGLLSLAQASAAASQGVFFMPYLSGERTPHMDPAARAGFVGLSLAHTRGSMIRAVVEGVCFALRQSFDILQAIAGDPVRIVVNGGAARHPLWLHTLSDILGRTIHPSPVEEAAARGAALLAGLGTGAFAGIDEALRQGVPAAGAPVEPDPLQAQMYMQAFTKFKELYPAVNAGQSAIIRKML